MPGHSVSGKCVGAHTSVRNPISMSSFGVEEEEEDMLTMPITRLATDNAPISPSIK